MKIIPIRFDEEMWELLKQIAKEMGLPVSTMIKFLLKKEIKEYEQKKRSDKLSD